MESLLQRQPSILSSGAFKSLTSSSCTTSTLRSSCCCHTGRYTSDTHFLEKVRSQHLCEEKWRWRTSFGGGPSTVMETRCSPRSKIKPSGRCSSLSDLSVLLRTLRNSSQSAKMRFMCLSNALNVPTSWRPSWSVQRIPIGHEQERSDENRARLFTYGNWCVAAFCCFFPASAKTRKLRERVRWKIDLYHFQSVWSGTTSQSETREKIQEWSDPFSHNKVSIASSSFMKDQQTKICVFSSSFVMK